MQELPQSSLWSRECCRKPANLIITFPNKSINPTKPKGTFLSVLHRGKCSVTQKGMRPTLHILHITIANILLQTSVDHWWAFQQVRLKVISLWASIRSQPYLNFHLIKKLPRVFLWGSSLLIFNHIIQDTAWIYNHPSQASWTLQSSENITLTEQIYAYVKCLCLCFVSQLFCFFILDYDTEHQKNSSTQSTTLLTWPMRV